MRDLDWNIIVTLHQTNSMTQTAKLLHVSQPSLSRRIQTIEEELGITLVFRNKSGSMFTPEGLRIVERAEQIVCTIQSIHAEIAEFNRGESGTLHLGVPHSYARFVLPSLLRQFTEQNPSIRFDIVMQMSDNLVRRVLENELDLCFARYMVEDEELEKIAVSEEQIFAVYHRPFAVEELLKLSLIEFPKNPAITAALDRWWSENFSASRHVRFKVNNGDSCLSMIHQGLGYGFFTDQKYFQYESGLFAQPLVFQDGAAFTRQTFLVYKKYILSNAVAARFIAFVQSLDFRQLEGLPKD